MSQYASLGSPHDPAIAPPPPRLELSINPADGSLLAAPLTKVLLAATDDLYSDLYNAAHGELDVTAAAQEGDNTNTNNNYEEENAIATQQTKRERLSNLSFAQRRHELAWRLQQHGKSLQHVSALTAAAACTDLAQAVAVSTTALQHARTAWVQADEAQDALYFFHAQLFPARAPPHDVYGALDVQLAGQWWDLPTDLRLSVDRFDTARESQWNRQEVDDRWHMAVRDKLLRGEVGWMRQQQQQQQQQQQIHDQEPSEPSEPKPLWKVSLRGGIVKLTGGNPKTLGSDETISYPIEALLSVLSTEKDPEWTLLSLEVRVQAKTGEFNHQLETSNRQRYDLHRLAALAMSREEARARRIREQKKDDSDNDSDDNAPEQDVAGHENGKDMDSTSIARPLHALFQVAHTFSLSWQLEVLSAQAQALRRGVWAASESNSLYVTPVRFFDTPVQDSNSMLGVVSISFWKVDDSYGPPSRGDLSSREANVNGENNDTNTHVKDMAGQRDYTKVTNQLTLSIRAEPDKGVQVSLSGASGIMRAMSVQPHLASTVQELLEAVSNPFALSASDALLAATRLCAERKCHAVAKALQPNEGKSILPDWILLTAERGSLAVSTRIKYRGLDNTEKKDMGMPILFRLVCDARTGSFVTTFPRSTLLLRKLASNDIESSEPMALRIASLPENRRRVIGASSSGRVVRDAFDGLTRSMNVLGQKAGVGGTWDNTDDRSVLLRERSIQSACADVRISLSKCCGMAALYGLAPLALGGATGLAAVADM
jgi:hypothetical protein